MSRTRRWIHARIVRRGFWNCSCDICHCGWSVRGMIGDAWTSAAGHAMDYHGGLDRHD